jgi:hypothetical protein
MSMQEIEELGSMEFFENRFNVAIELRRNGRLLEELEEDVGTLHAYTIHQEDGELHIEEEIPLSKCTQEHFPHASHEGFEEFEMESGWCIDEHEALKAGGKPGIDIYHSVAITLERARGGN